MKKIYLIFIITILVSACSRNRTEVIELGNAQQVITADDYKSELETIKMSEIELSLHMNGNIGPIYIYNDIVYYSVDFIDYLTDHTGKGPVIEFEDKYNTEIRMYNVKTGENELLYKYNEARPISVSDIQCNGKALVWEDYPLGEMWRVKLFDLESRDEPVDILSYNIDNGEMFTIVLTITDDSLFWYDMLGGHDYPINLYRYDLATKKTYKEIENLSLSSPYEHVNIVNGFYTTYRKHSDNTATIYIHKMDSKEKLELHIEGNVSDPISNGEICVWVAGYNSNEREKVFVYNIREDTFIEIEVPYVFSYALVNNDVLINQSYEGLYYYNTNSKKYHIIDGTEGTLYMYTVQGILNNAYAEVMGNEENLKIVNFSK